MTIRSENNDLEDQNFVDRLLIELFGEEDENVDESSSVDSGDAPTLELGADRRSRGWVARLCDYLVSCQDRIVITKHEVFIVATMFVLFAILILERVSR
jgi:hypothetical protein